MDWMKDWILNVGIKTMGPSAVRGAVLGAAGWMAMKNNWLVPIGISTVNNVTTIDWTKVSAWAIAGIPAVTAALIKMFNHHGNDVVGLSKTTPEVTK